MRRVKVFLGWTLVAIVFTFESMTIIGLLTGCPTATLLAEVLDL